MNLNQNNLDKAISPYLNHHKNNPINWQEWTQEVLDYAKTNNKPIFLSIGYSTCHWCHVMAREAFSNQKIADYLNKYFVSIKVDREQRPDIDKKMMDFLVKFTGNGGWPLNVFLQSDLQPFFGLTYASTKDNFGIPSFQTILEHVNENHKKIINIENKKDLEYIENIDQELKKLQDIEENQIINSLNNYFDNEHSGFGNYQKFPQPSTLLFILHYYEETKNQDLKIMIKKTLDKMIVSGLHDHLGGGFFRYTVDREWQIPHFEKMLYDQAMLLWVYSIAYKIFNDNNYKLISEKIINCLKKTYEDSGLFVTAHDADTNHIEGETYLWTYQELKSLLSDNEFNKLENTYLISKSGNFKGKIHLIKKNPDFSENITNIENKLLITRNNKDQPFTDKKILTNLNSLTGIAFINAFRYIENKDLLEFAKNIFSNIIKKQFINNKLAHTSLNNKIQEQEFLEDYASLLLFVTYLHEETNNYKEHLNSFYEKIKKFKVENKWIESNNDDFTKVYSDYYDHPIPSSSSLAELALLRSNILLGKQYLKNENFKEPLKHDFLNLSIQIKKGLFHIITTENKINWNLLPLNTMQVIGDRFEDCYKGSCSLNDVYG